MRPLTPEQTEALVQVILTGPAIKQPSALFELIKAVSDPGGDQDRYELALDAMRCALPLTREYDEWAQTRMTLPVRVDLLI